MIVSAMAYASPCGDVVDNDKVEEGAAKRNIGDATDVLDRSTDELPTDELPTDELPTDDVVVACSGRMSVRYHAAPGTNRDRH
jgi:hypothetical protein